eukprot:GHVS01022799.1.p1 GENE.GHVS01022799.1~~GHVS01022799.1.p1  ORF type:complete len:281 (+),score=43.71 GHVS01022799.1:1414-2256(+)
MGERGSSIEALSAERVISGVASPQTFDYMGERGSSRDALSAEKEMSTGVSREKEMSAGVSPEAMSPEQESAVTFMPTIERASPEGEELLRGVTSPEGYMRRGSSRDALSAEKEMSTGVSREKEMSAGVSPEAMSPEQESAVTFMPTIEGEELLRGVTSPEGYMRRGISRDALPAENNVGNDAENLQKLHALIDGNLFSGVSLDIGRGSSRDALSAEKEMSTGVSREAILQDLKGEVARGISRDALPAENNVGNDAENLQKLHALIDGNLFSGVSVSLAGR